MRTSYGTITKRTSNNLRLIDQLDYYGKLSSQLEWQNGDNRRCRIVYTKSGEPTASILLDDRSNRRPPALLDFMRDDR